MSPDATVFIVDDDHAVRESLQRLIESTNMRAETFPDGRRFLEHYDPSRPGCLLLDIHMRGMDGLELQDVLRRAGAAIPVIIISAHGNVEQVVRAMKAGAVHFVQKPYKAKVLLTHVRDALELDARLRLAAAQRTAATERLRSLTPREREVLDLLVTGMPAKRVAAELGLSRKTVDVHRGHIMLKLGAESIIELGQLVQRSRAADVRPGLAPGPLVDQPPPIH